jgi:hypothetical protein
MAKLNRFSDILQENNLADLERAFRECKAADNLAPLPSGTYEAHIIDGTLGTSRSKGTPFYKLTFRVCDGEHKGRRFWHDVYLTAPAMPLAKRDLAKMGIQRLEQLQQPLPQGICCRVKLALRSHDDGTQYNHVSAFDVIRYDKPEIDPFALDDDDATPANVPTSPNPLPLTTGATSKSEGRDS